MLLDDDPAALIQECIDNFSIHSDRAALIRITSSLSTLQTHRASTLNQQTTSLKRAQRHLHTLEHQHSLSVAQHDPAEHAARILGLDKEKFRVAKEASDAEIEGERLEGELGGLDRALSNGAAAGGGVGSGDVWEGQTKGESLQDVLRLKLYRSLGIEMETEEGTGALRRAVVRNTGRGEASVVDVAGARGACTEKLWKAL